MQERVKRKRAVAVGKWISSSLGQCASTRSVKQFLGQKHIPVFDHPRYSPDLATCDFSQKSSALEGTCFEPVPDVRGKNDFRTSF